MIYICRFAGCKIGITTCHRISCWLVESRPPSMPIFLSLDELFILVFDVVNFCVVNMKYTMKCVSTVYSCKGMIWSWRVKWPDFKTLPLCYALCRHDTLTHMRSWISKSLPIVWEIAHLPSLRLSPVFFSPPPDFSPEDLNKEIQMYQGKAPDKSRAVFALSHSIMNEQEVPEEARSPGKPWFAHFFSLCPSYFKSFLNYPLILHLSDPGSFFSVTSALMLAFSSSGTFFSLST